MLFSCDFVIETLWFKGFETRKPSHSYPSLFPWLGHPVMVSHVPASYWESCLPCVPSKGRSKGHHTTCHMTPLPLADWTVRVKIKCPSLIDLSIYYEETWNQKNMKALQLLSFISWLVLSFPGAALTKNHKLSGSSERNLLSLSSGG